MVQTHSNNVFGFIRTFKGHEGKTMAIFLSYGTICWQNIGELVYVVPQVIVVKAIVLVEAIVRVGAMVRAVAIVRAEAIVRVGVISIRKFLDE